jgi:hypothetical protein
MYAFLSNETVQKFVNMLDGGVLKTPIGIKIEAATRKELPATDWSLNLEICDMINSAQDG